MELLTLTILFFIESEFLDISFSGRGTFSLWGSLSNSSILQNFLATSVAYYYLQFN